MKKILLFIFILVNFWAKAQDSEFDNVYIRDELYVRNSTIVDLIQSTPYIQDSIQIKGYTIRFNESEGVHEFLTAKSGVVWQGALEDLFQVYNNTGASIPNGTPVYFSGVNGDSILTIDYATSSNAIKTLRFAGVTTVTIANNDWGFATNRGKVRDMNTSALSQVGALFLSSDSSFTNTKPAYPDEVLVIGGVIKVGTTDGVIYVNPSFALRRQFAQRDYNFTSQGILAGTFYRGGFYDVSTTDANLTQASTTQTYGTASVAYSAHPFIVAGGAGTVDAGVVGLRVTGTSIDDNGTRTPSDADTILTDITSVALNEYYEAKKYLGTVTYELIIISGSPTTYSFDFNYGYAKYEDAGNRDFYVAGIEIVGLAGSNDTGFDIELLFHKSTGWTYASTGFVPGDGAVARWSTDMAPEDNLGNGIDFAWKRANLNQFINGDDSEGVLFRITTGSGNSVQSMDMHITVALDQ
jgi:hypothetical protein